MAKKPKRRLTEAQKAERKRISAYDRAVREANKRYNELLNKGFIDPGIKYVTNGKFTPPRPKKITPASIRKVKSFTKEYFYRKLQYINPETGETLTGKQGQFYVRKYAAEKAQITKRAKAILADEDYEWQYNWIDEGVRVDELVLVEEIINSLPNSVWTRGRKRVDLEPLKNNLRQIMWDKFNSYETDYEQGEYIRYLERKKAELEDTIHKINASDQMEVLKSFSRAADILNRGPLTISDKKELGKADEV